MDHYMTRISNLGHVAQLSVFVVKTLNWCSFLGRKKKLIGIIIRFQRLIVGHTV